MNNFIGYCGIDCWNCDAYLATINDDQELRRKTAEKWSELNKTVILPEQINCEGCRMNGVKTIYCESLCPIRQCAIKKDLEICWDCSAFKHCSKLWAIIKSNPESLINLERNN